MTKVNREAYDYLPPASPQWAGGSEIHFSEQEITRDDMVDDGATSGHFDLIGMLPVGAVPLFWVAQVSEGFTGDASAVIKVGVAADDDRFSADTSQSVFAPGVVGSAVIAADALKGAGSIQTVRVTITSGTDFGLVSAGRLSLRMYYVRTV